MRLSTLCIVGLSAPVVAYAFLPQSLRSPTQQALRSNQRIKNDVEVNTPWSQDDCSFTQLNMAFDSDKPSNMFDGPMALTKERDACGVGFIANTKSGGTNMREILRFHSRREFCVLNFVFLFSVLQKNSVPTESLNRVFLPSLAWNIAVLVEVTASLVMVQVS
jgi:hypothetical protein